MQEEGGDKKPSANHAEEWQTSSARRLPQLWHKGISDREGLDD